MKRVTTYLNYILPDGFLRIMVPLATLALCLNISAFTTENFSFFDYFKAYINLTIALGLGVLFINDGYFPITYFKNRWLGIFSWFVLRIILMFPFFYVVTYSPVCMAPTNFIMLRFPG